MARNVIVRFTESQTYDINRDAEVVRFMATTSSGSFWSDVALEGPRSLRQDRQAFKDTVVDLINAGSLPCEVLIDGETQ